MCVCIGHVGERVQFCKTHGLSIRAVGVCEDLIQQLMKYLKAKIRLRDTYSVRTAQ
jgi:hypothetical protein